MNDQNSKRVTLKILAEKLGVSTMTVSRALNDHPDISQATKDKIKHLAEELNYRPNIIAKSLVQKRTNTIGVIFPEITFSFFPEVLKGIEEVAYQSGFHVIITISDDQSEREKEAIQSLEAKQVDGILISIAQNTTDPAPFLNLKNENIPFVFFDRYINGFDANRVLINDRQGAFDLTNHLAKLGYKTIGHLTGPMSVSICRDRMTGYREALKANHLKFNQEFVIETCFDEQSGYQAMQTLLNKAKLPQAVFAATDPMAISAMQAIKEANFKIPDDIALVGFADLASASIVEIPLTTMRQPAYEMGKISTTILIEDIKNKESTYDKKIILETELIIRESCGYRKLKI
ncbi:LacI family DNA-binding transcriptional regulator [candidate division KSB1 bacterium]|nr:LacI family DNA-binding transcriptional regulator [candidate division KSB1 bacterium]